ncbi:MAG: hypothetical protein ACYCPW_09410 [Nitrososphaerales archaeon]
MLSCLLGFPSDLLVCLRAIVPVLLITFSPADAALSRFRYYCLNRLDVVQSFGMLVRHILIAGRIIISDEPDADHVPLFAALLTMNVLLYGPYDSLVPLVKFLPSLGKP